MAIADGFTLANKARPRVYTPPQYFRTKEEMCELFKDIPSAIENSVEIAKRCNENKSIHTNDVEQLRREFLALKADYLERVVKLLRKIY